MPSDKISIHLRAMLRALEDASDLSAAADYWNHPGISIKAMAENTAKQINQYETSIGYIPSNSSYSRFLLAEIANTLRPKPSTHSNKSLSAMIYSGASSSGYSKRLFPPNISFSDGIELMRASIVDVLNSDKRNFNLEIFIESISKLSDQIMIDYFLNYISLLERTIGGWISLSTNKNYSKAVAAIVTDIGAYARQLAKSLLAESKVEIINKITFSFDNLERENLIAGEIWSIGVANYEYTGDTFDKMYGEIRSLEKFVRQRLTSQVKVETKNRFVPDADEIAKKVPEQQIAPVQFGNNGERIVVLHQPAITSSKDVSLISSVRRSLIRNGGRLLEALKTSQCDRRFLSDLEDLQKEIESNEDIIELGLECQRCQTASMSFGDEFSDYHKGLLNGHFQALIDYVGQFDEWQRYLIKATESKMLLEEHVAILRQVTRDLISHARDSDVVEPEVIKKLEWLDKLIVEGRILTNRAVMAVATSLSNMAAAAIKWSSKLFKEYSDETRKMMAKGVAFITVCSLVGGLSQFIPISEIISHNGWLAMGLMWMSDAKNAIVRDIGDKSL